jgi:hypothetical protein
LAMQELPLRCCDYSVNKFCHNWFERSFKKFQKVFCCFNNRMKKKTWQVTHTVAIWGKIQQKPIESGYLESKTWTISWNDQSTYLTISPIRTP